MALVSYYDRKESMCIKYPKTNANKIQNSDWIKKSKEGKTYGDSEASEKQITIYTEKKWERTTLVVRQKVLFHTDSLPFPRTRASSHRSLPLVHLPASIFPN